ncbi:MAG: hypothetical protein IJF94_04865 [Eubacterium sp.]|nr:hypothetical protein [Eubacterium sp.]
MLYDKGMDNKKGKIILHKGLPIIQDLLTYTIIDKGEKEIEYDIGGIYCEYIRNKPIEFKSTIIRTPYFKEKYSEKKLFESMDWIKMKLLNHYPPVPVLMLIGSMVSIIDSTIRLEEKELLVVEEEYRSQFEYYDEVKEYVLKDSGIKNTNNNSIGEIIMNAYIIYIIFYGLAREEAERAIPFFERNADFDDEKLSEFPSELFAEFLSMQHIDYNIASLKGGLKPIYTPRTPLSLFIFELSNMLEYGATLVKCKNCGKYFVPSGRNDTKYCGYESPQTTGKTCKEIGAQLSRIKKEKEDELTREYRKKYMSLLMRKKRHPDNEKYQQDFDEYKKNIAMMREKYDKKKISKKDYIEWIKNY